MEKYYMNDKIESLLEQMVYSISKVKTTSIKTYGPNISELTFTYEGKEFKIKKPNNNQLCASLFFIKKESQPVEIHIAYSEKTDYLFNCLSMSIDFDRYGIEEEINKIILDDF